jgi:hypothetical protein
MTIPVASTFDYVATVPSDPRGGPWVARQRTEVAVTGNNLLDARLLGLTPTLEMADADPPVNAGYTRGVWRPWVLRSRLTLRAASKTNAAASSASFHLDRSVVAAMRPGDVFHVARTPCAGLGMSLVREGRLVFALGAVTAVPLGSNVVAQRAVDLMEQVRAVYRSRDPLYETDEIPIELVIDGRLSIGGRNPHSEAYAALCHHGFLIGIPGTDESCAITCRDLCSETGANASLALLLADGLELTQW